MQKSKLSWMFPPDTEKNLNLKKDINRHLSSRSKKEVYFRITLLDYQSCGDRELKTLGNTGSSFSCFKS